VGEDTDGYRLPRYSFCEKKYALFHMVTASIISITSGRKFVYVSLRCYREGRCASNGVNKQSRRLDTVKSLGR